MIAAEIKALPMAEKIQIMEALWEEFRSNYDESDISIEMKSLLDQRRKRVRSGESQLLDWDSVKNQIGRR
ncbi:MAG: addiction module protein [Verrucomicrobiaceae bacterium]|jgi:putative addiction module component (TIGR02574 family)|nr:addiction module protein [Verrucomicrobiaceae bacterium]